MLRNLLDLEEDVVKEVLKHLIVGTTKEILTYRLVSKKFNQYLTSTFKPDLQKVDIGEDYYMRQVSFTWSSSVPLSLRINDSITCLAVFESYQNSSCVSRRRVVEIEVPQPTKYTEKSFDSFPRSSYTYSATVEYDPNYVLSIPKNSVRLVFISQQGVIFSNKIEDLRMPGSSRGHEFYWNILSEANQGKS
eukprot:TRINITY_DN8059_c0_g1_i1.p1 TRINITY_DN8059_c0_g1~~TRINITY_DN8059_c0_g1_i1.p1  ORF type:complete len:191 (-),score=20.41 TRINITY_DN8059_c0_g1_i1:183-755(-)